MLKKLFLLFALISLLAVPAMAQAQEEEDEEYDCPAFVGAPDAERTSYYMGEGAAFMRQGDYSAAINSYGCIVTEIDEDYRNAYFNRAAAYTARRIYDEAIEDYDDVLRVDSGFAPAFNNRALVYIAIEEYDEAMSDLDSAIDANPNYAEAYINRGILFGILEEYDSARGQFERAIELGDLESIVEELSDPDRPDDAEDPVFNVSLARAYALLGIIESQEALANYENYLLLTGNRASGRIQSAAGALESRFNFELRFDDGSWILIADFIQP